MLIEIIAALIIGVLFGIFTGLFPGIHINLVAAGLLALIGSSFFAGIEPLVLVTFIVAMAMTHTFIDFIPSIFLGAPEEDTFLSVLPGHQLLKEGKGFEAVVLTLYGGIIALPIILLFSIVFVYLLPYVFDFVRIYIPYILIFISLFLIFREEEFLISLIIFIFAGFLGLLTFNLPVRGPLLPLLSGLFGLSGLVVSVKNKVKIPEQKFQKLKEIKLEKKSFWKTSFAAAVAAPLCSFLPGIGSGHAAVIGSEIIGKEGENNRNFLFLVGALNTIVMALSFVTAYAIGKTRTGASAAIQEILETISFSNLLIILLVVLISAVASFFVGLRLTKVFAKLVSKIDYSKISLIVIFILILVNLVLSNWIGLIVLATGAALGIFTILSGTRRINLMGCLLLPSIVFYLTL